jgi:hypothetical protein
MIDEVSFDEPTSEVGSGSVCVDVIGTVLCIVFDNENSGLIPDRTFSEGLDKKTNSQVVVRDVCVR